MYVKNVKKTAYAYMSPSINNVTSYSKFLN